MGGTAFIESVHRAQACDPVHGQTSPSTLVAVKLPARAVAALRRRAAAAGTVRTLTLGPGKSHNSLPYSAEELIRDLLMAYLVDADEIGENP